jgi:hypothetical protein
MGVVPARYHKAGFERPVKSSTGTRSVRHSRRFQLDLSQEALKQFDELVAGLQMPTRAAVFRHGLGILTLILKQLNDGGNLGMTLNGSEYLIPLIGLGFKALVIEKPVLHENISPDKIFPGPVSYVLCAQSVRRSH